MCNEIGILYTIGESVEWLVLLWKIIWKFLYVKKVHALT